MTFYAIFAKFSSASRKPAMARRGGRVLAVCPNEKSGDFGAPMIVAAECRRDQAGGAIADRPAVDAHHGQHDLARGCDEGLARAIGFFHGKCAFLEGKPLPFD